MTDHLLVHGRAIEVAWWEPLHSRLLTCVFLHEGLGSVSMWRDFPGHFATHTSCRTMAYSRLGHGASDPPPKPPTPRFMHDEAQTELPAVLDAAHIDTAVLFGHSDGGSIAIIFAALCPQRTRALILEAPHVFVEDISIKSISRMKELYETTDLRQRLARHHHDVDAAFHGWNDVWLNPGFRDWNIEEYLSRITCPVLIVQGEQDEYGTHAQVDAIVEGLRAPVETLTLPDCGHSPHRDQPEAVLERAAEFMAKL